MYKNMNVCNTTNILSSPPPSPPPYYARVEIEALVRIYRKLVSNCKVTAKATSGSSVIAKPHSTVEVSTSTFHVHPHVKRNPYICMGMESPELIIKSPKWKSNMELFNIFPVIWLTGRHVILLVDSLRASWYLGTGINWNLGRCSELWKDEIRKWVPWIF